MRGNKTLDVSSSDDELEVEPVKANAQAKERFPNGVKKTSAEPKRKRETAGNDDGTKTKTTQKRRLNQTATAKTAKQQRGKATAPPPDGSMQIKTETVAAVKNEGQSVKKEEPTANSVKKETKPRVKVEYGRPGQTKPTPAENDPKRKFYCSLLEEIPRSEIARRWCVMHGLLDTTEAEEWNKEAETKKKRELSRRRYAKETQIKKEQRLKKEEPQ